MGFLDNLKESLGIDNDDNAVEEAKKAADEAQEKAREAAEKARTESADKAARAQKEADQAAADEGDEGERDRPARRQQQVAQAPVDRDRADLDRVGRKNARQRDGEQNRRQGHDDFGESHQNRVDPAADGTGDRTEGQPADEAEERGEHAHDQRLPAPDEQAREQVATAVVGAAIAEGLA